MSGLVPDRKVTRKGPPKKTKIAATPVTAALAAPAATRHPVEEDEEVSCAAYLPPIVAVGVSYTVTTTCLSTNSKRFVERHGTVVNIIS